MYTHKQYPISYFKQAIMFYKLRIPFQKLPNITYHYNTVGMFNIINRNINRFRRYNDENIIGLKINDNYMITIISSPIPYDYFFTVINDNKVNNSYKQYPFLPSIITNKVLDVKQVEHDVYQKINIIHFLNCQVIDILHRTRLNL